MRLAVFLLLVLAPAICQGATTGKRPWSVRDTVSQALSYSPAVKSKKESVRMAKESVRQAKAGHLPKVDVEARTGFGSLPVYKYD